MVLEKYKQTISGFVGPSSNFAYIFLNANAWSFSELFRASDIHKARFQADHVVRLLVLRIQHSMWISLLCILHTNITGHLVILLRKCFCFHHAWSLFLYVQIWMTQCVLHFSLLLSASQNKVRLSIWFCYWITESGSGTCSSYRNCILPALDGIHL